VDGLRVMRYELSREARGLAATRQSSRVSLPIIGPPDIDRDAALLVAEKPRSEIGHAELVGIGSITASLGLAVLPTDAGEPEELLRKADRALYTAKQSGRNRVHAFSRLSLEAPLESQV
jgi:predicted signal transduction protein with EAL and GGDEF domain